MENKKQTTLTVSGLTCGSILSFLCKKRSLFALVSYLNPFLYIAIIMWALYFTGTDFAAKLFFIICAIYFSCYYLFSVEHFVNSNKNSQ